jgi:putative methyltransferase (TIGR04325 family)
MPFAMNHLVGQISPPALLRLALRIRSWIGWGGFVGNFTTFAQAAAASTGYNDPAIAAAMNVEEELDRSVSERDQQILAAMSAVDGFRILDVGGATGHYCRLVHRFRPNTTAVVLETPAMVAAARQTDWLRYTASTEGLGEFDVTLMSGFLQYVEDPYRAFDEMAAHGRYVLINRLPLTAADRLTVQRVRGRYRASYPAWFLSRSRFLAHVSQSHQIVMQWAVPQDAPMLDGRRVVYQGMLLLRKTCPSHKTRPAA